MDEIGDNDGTSTAQLQYVYELILDSALCLLTFLDYLICE